MQATFLMHVTKIPVLKLASFCEAIAPWPVKYVPMFRSNLWYSALRYLENGSRGVFEDPAALSPGKGAVKPEKNFKILSKKKEI